MGKGDKKSRRGKIILGTYGVRRLRKKSGKPKVKQRVESSKDNDLRDKKLKKAKQKAEEQAEKTIIREEKKVVVADEASGPSEVTAAAEQKKTEAKPARAAKKKRTTESTGTPEKASRTRLKESPVEKKKPGTKDKQGEKQEVVPEEHKKVK